MDEDVKVLEAKVAGLAGQVVALQIMLEVAISTHQDADRLGRTFYNAVSGFLDGTLPTPIMEEAREGIEYMRDNLLRAIEKKPYVLGWGEAPGGPQ
jgi:hypothetical protein